MSLNTLVSDIFLRLDELYLVCHRFFYALRLSLILAKSDRVLFLCLWSIIHASSTFFENNLFFYRRLFFLRCLWLLGLFLRWLSLYLWRLFLYLIIVCGALCCWFRNTLEQRFDVQAAIAFFRNFLTKLWKHILQILNKCQVKFFSNFIRIFAYSDRF